MKRTTPEDARLWKKYMSKRGNGGVPSCIDVEKFSIDTRSNPELRLKVLSELRERAHMGTSNLFGQAALSISALAIFATVLGSVVDQESLVILFYFSGLALLIAISVPALAIVMDSKSRHATSWLAAYLEAIEGEGSRGDTLAPSEAGKELERLRQFSPGSWGRVRKLLAKATHRDWPLYRGNCARGAESLINE